MEKLECLSKRLQEAEEMVKVVPDLNKKIASLEVSESKLGSLILVKLLTNTLLLAFECAGTG